MSGERDLDKLQRQLAPTLHPGTFVYCTFPDFRLPAGLDPICIFRESEGLTAVVEQAAADRADLPHVFRSKLITLTVHSSLEAIGLLAVVATRLASAGIACNAVAGYHHDHLFVPEERAQQALTVLLEMSTQQVST